MRTPASLAEAKAVIDAEKAKLSSALSAVAGARWLAALLTTFVIAFGANLLYSRDTLPAIGGISLTTFGLPPGLDFGIVGEQARQAGEAAARQGAGDVVADFLAGHRDLVPILNGVGFVLSLALLFGNLWIMTKRRPYTRG